VTVTFANPPGVHPPGSRYSHAALVEAPAKRLLVSGQVGTRPDGTIAEGGEAQIAQALENLRVILAAHGMTPAHVVKLNSFLTDRALVGAWRAARDAFMGDGPAPTGTLLVVAGLAHPRFVFEVEAEAVA
jgi:enamine deaminase RidA (YjgF/YER057c/UK114 family)